MHTQLTEDKCPNCFLRFLFIRWYRPLVNEKRIMFLLFCNGYKSHLQLMFAVFVFRQITRLTGYIFPIMLDCVDSFACVRFCRDMYSQWESDYYKLTRCKKFRIVVLIVVWRVKCRNSVSVKLQQHVQRHASATNRFVCVFCGIMIFYATE